MPATYVTVAQLRAALGIGTLYNDATLESVCQAAENIIKDKLWFNDQSVVALQGFGSYGKIFLASTADQFYVGQTVTVENVRQHFNGNKTLTAVNGHSVTFNLGTAVTEPYHQVVPYGRVYAATNIDYETLPEVNQASLMIAVDIYQARQASNAGGISPDFQPSPYRMGNTLMARVRGLLADHLAPGGQVG
jgi:hypothetical protein